MPPRRFSSFVLLALLAFAVVLLVSARSSTPSLSQAAASAEDLIPKVRDTISHVNLPKFEVPSFHFSFHKSSHRPAEQKNSTHEDSSWFSDWKWRNPFSSSVTLDEDRAVLPPLKDRTPVYTYYESSSSRNADSSRVDYELLQTWRRAWWAQGFRPVVLSPTDAMAHPLYQSMQTQGLSKSMEFEMSRWLAWSHMGTGLLSSWHCVPMTAHDDTLLAFLRRGQFDRLIRFDGLEAGLFAGDKFQIDDAVETTLSSPDLQSHETMIEALGDDSLKTEQHSSLAHYNMATIEARYPSLAKEIKENPKDGQRALHELIDAHLHLIWQNSFTDGIAVMKPMPGHTTALIEPSTRLAKLLSECPNSMLPASCPPNKPRCTPCVSSKMRVSTVPSFRNSSTLYNIGTVPHPYTLILLNNQTGNTDISHIRRNTDRDQWITSVTRDLLGDGRGAPSRLVAIKDAIASDASSYRSLWFSAEQFPISVFPPPPQVKSPVNEERPHEAPIVPFPEDWLADLDWHFGFPIPRAKIPHGESYTPVPGPERWGGFLHGLPAEKKKSWDPAPPTDEELSLEINTVKQASSLFQGSGDQRRTNTMVAAAEAWNLADTEVWKFVKAFSARSYVERKQWQDEESAFDRTGKGKGKSRWWLV